MIEAEEVLLGENKEGRKIYAYYLRNSNGQSICFLNLGCTFCEWNTKDKWGKMSNIVLGYSTLDEYLDDRFYLGSTIGRVANRIGNGRFSLDDRIFEVEKNLKPHTLHGGNYGFDQKIWKSKIIKKDGKTCLFMQTESEDGDQGFPGHLKIDAFICFNNQGQVDINFRATTNAPTVVNMTNHVYFNLSGSFGQKILDHALKINAEQILETDCNQIPTGHLRQVEGSPFDFRVFKAIGKDIEYTDELLISAKGYDHFFVSQSNRPLVSCYHRDSGRRLDMTTNQKGVHLYTGNYLQGDLFACGESNRVGLCLEAQNYPDSPNHDHFPSIVLRPGEEYLWQTAYRVYLEEDCFSSLTGKL